MTKLLRIARSCLANAYRRLISGNGQYILTLYGAQPPGSINSNTQSPPEDDRLPETEPPLTEAQRLQGFAAAFEHQRARFPLLGRYIDLAEQGRVWTLYLALKKDHSFSPDEKIDIRVALLRGLSPSNSDDQESEPWV